MALGYDRRLHFTAQKSQRLLTCLFSIRTSPVFDCSASLSSSAADMPPMLPNMSILRGFLSILRCPKIMLWGGLKVKIRVTRFSNNFHHCSKTRLKILFGADREHKC